MRHIEQHDAVHAETEGTPRAVAAAESPAPANPSPPRTDRSDNAEGSDPTATSQKLRKAK